MITIVFGKPGTGKTAYLTANAVKYLNNSLESILYYVTACNTVEELNSAGLNYSIPVHAPVYTNYATAVNFGSVEGNKAYFVNAFHLGFENKDVKKIINVYPGAKLFLAEAQRIYNSRQSDKFPDWVSRYFEEHRHYDLSIMLDVQRPGLIDINIRELADEFIMVDKIVQKKDKYGIVRQTTFYVKAFSEYKFVDSYLANGTKNYEERKVVFNFNPFSYYESKSYFKSFLPNSKTDFWQVEHLNIDDAEKDIELFKMMYEQTPPKGFYKKR